MTPPTKATPQASDDAADTAEVVELYLDAKAAFCLGTRIAPSEYDEMTPSEVAAFVRRHNEMHK